MMGGETMLFVGIDAGKRHWVCILNEKRREVVPKFAMGNSRREYEKLEALAGSEAKLCIEDTGSYSLPLFSYLKKRGCDIIMIKGLRSKRLREYVRENIKTDLVDCEVLAMVRLLESVLPTVDAGVAASENRLKPISRLYCEHARRRSKLRQQLVSMLQSRCPELAEAFHKPASKVVLGILRWVPREAWEDAARTQELLADEGIVASRKNVERTLACLRGSVGIEGRYDTSLSVLIDSYLAEVKLIKNLEEHMAIELLKTPYATLVMLPNVNLVTAAILAGEAGDIRRFPSVRKFVKYCGFRFTQEQSGDKDRKKLQAVSTAVRWVLSSVATGFVQHDAELRVFAERLKKRGKKGLVVRYAVARKVLVRLYFEMLRMQDMTLEKNVEALDGEKLLPAMRKAVEFWREKVPVMAEAG